MFNLIDIQSLGLKRFLIIVTHYLFSMDQSDTFDISYFWISSVIYLTLNARHVLTITLDIINHYRIINVMGDAVRQFARLS